MTDKLAMRFHDDVRGVVLPFRPRLRDAVEIANVALIDIPPTIKFTCGAGSADATTLDHDYAMDNDTSPCERNPDPFADDMMQRNAKAD